MVFSTWLGFHVIMWYVCEVKKGESKQEQDVFLADILFVHAQIQISVFQNADLISCNLTPGYICTFLIKGSTFMVYNHAKKKEEQPPQFSDYDNYSTKFIISAKIN